MLFTSLLNKIEYSGTVAEREVESITNDSRRANGHSVFVCVKGFATDGHNYAKNAYDLGCRCFVAERSLDLPSDASVAIVSNSRLALAILSCEIHGNPSHKIAVIGITGTKGKTTTALMIKHILESLGIPTGYIGSNGVSYAGVSRATQNTTPESHILQGYLSDMHKAGMKAAVVEISSQALYLNRTYGTKFRTTVFSNLSPDHIGPGEHASFDEYFAAKKKLFDQYSSELVIANADDEYTSSILADCTTKTLTYSIISPSDYRATDITRCRTESMLGSEFVCHTNGKSYSIALSVPGEFNIHNALAAIAVAHSMGKEIPDIASSLSSVNIEGRFETFSAPGGACFVIDYAHNGLSLTSALKALRAYEPNRLICLFGSVGERTVIRREQLGRAAAKWADFSIITSDNPNHESCENIINEIALHFDDEDSYIAIPDRKKAIEYAVRIAEGEDIVLLAGKGHEKYQLIDGKNHYFCEREIIEESIKNLNPA